MSETGSTLRIPVGVANISFGGPKWNQLFIAAGQSLYALHAYTQGATPGRQRRARWDESSRPVRP